MGDYADFVAGVESPTGEDNRMGSGAFSKYQLMPATAAGLAQRTAWGKGLTPANVRGAVMDPDPAVAKARADELFKLYSADSSGALAKAGMPADNTSMLALHRFGQGGGVSLMNAPGNMPVTDWVNSVNWGPGVGAGAVIKQNGLDRYANVDALRKGFLGGAGGAKSADPSIAAIVADQPPPEPAEPPLIQAQQPGVSPANMLAAQDLLASAFMPRQSQQAPQPQPLFRFRPRQAS